MELRLEPHPEYPGTDNLMAGDVVLGQIDQPLALVLRGLARDWPWPGLAAFPASVASDPDRALAMAYDEMTEARERLGAAYNAARMGDVATVRARLARVDAAVAAAKAWRALAGFGDP